MVTGRIVRGSVALGVGMLLVFASTVAAAADVLIEIPRADSIVIDGRTDDWGGRGFRVDALAPANGDLSARGDFAGGFRLAWDERRLLVLANVRRDAEARGSGAGESVEILLGCPPSIDRYLVVIAPGRVGDRGEATPVCTDYRQMMEARQRPLKVSAASAITSEGYAIEALLPWANLDIHPQAGQDVMVQVRINDIDRGGGRTQYRWNPSSNNLVGATYRVRLSDRASPPIEAAAAGGLSD